MASEMYLYLACFKDDLVEKCQTYVELFIGLFYGSC
jgi:hypothetical protein